MVRVSERGLSSTASPKCAAASDPDQLKSAREDIKKLLDTSFCHPILVFSINLNSLIMHAILFTLKLLQFHQVFASFFFAF